MDNPFFPHHGILWIDLPGHLSIGSPLSIPRLCVLISLSREVLNQIFCEWKSYMPAKEFVFFYLSFIWLIFSLIQWLRDWRGMHSELGSWVLAKNCPHHHGVMEWVWALEPTSTIASWMNDFIQISQFHQTNFRIYKIGREPYLLGLL